MRNTETVRRVYVVADIAKGLSPVADHILRTIEALADANARFALDHDTKALIASHNGLSSAELEAVLDSIEKAGALRYLGVDRRCV